MQTVVGLWTIAAQSFDLLDFGASADEDNQRARLAHVYLEIEWHC